MKKSKKVVANLYDKIEYVIHIKNLKQALNHGLVLKKFKEWLNLIKILKSWKIMLFSKNYGRWDKT